MREDVPFSFHMITPRGVGFEHDVEFNCGKLGRFNRPSLVEAHRFGVVEC